MIEAKTDFIKVRFFEFTSLHGQNFAHAWPDGQCWSSRMNISRVIKSIFKKEFKVISESKKLPLLVAFQKRKINLINNIPTILKACIFKFCNRKWIACNNMIKMHWIEGLLMYLYFNEIINSDVEKISTVIKVSLK